jgi:hypothetical protein
MQILLDRIEVLEGQTARWKLLVTAAILLAAIAIAIPTFGIPLPGTAPPAPRPAPEPTTIGTGKFTVVEAGAFLLRDDGGRVAGGLQARDSTVRLVLGSRGGTGVAFMEVRNDGSANLTLRSERALESAPGVALVARPDNSGAVKVIDGRGRTRAFGSR